MGHQVRLNSKIKPNNIHSELAAMINVANAAIAGHAYVIFHFVVFSEAKKSILPAFMVLALLFFRSKLKKQLRKELRIVRDLEWKKIAEFDIENW